jgi:hypothetical protein
MKYTLLTSDGRLMQFYVKSMADLYQNLYGGTIMTEAILSSKALDKTTVTV